ncbi:hypothetical protein QDQ26_21320, partial [Enterobacter hormaechei]
RTSCPNRIPVISKLVLVLDIYSSLSLIWRYSYCLVFQGATSFYSLHELFNKLNGYTTRLVQYQTIRPSLGRGAISAIGAFFKWYLFSGAWRQGKVGVVTGVYATAYSFLKYFKAWYQDREKKESVAKEQSDSYLAE